MNMASRTAIESKLSLGTRGIRPGQFGDINESSQYVTPVSAKSRIASETGTNIRPDRSENSIKEEAIANIKKSNPSLFLSMAQIRQGLLPSMLKQFGVSEADYGTSSNVTGTRKVNVELALQTERAYQSNLQRQENLVNQEYERIYRQEVITTAKRMQSDTIAGRANAAAAEDAARAALEKQNALKSANARSEAEAEYAIKNDPELADKFGSVQTIWKTLENEPAQSREDLIKQLEDQAASLVDKPYEQEKEAVNEALKLKLQNLNDKFNLFSDQQKYELDTAIDGLDRSSAETLTTTLESLARRGVLDSGLLRRIANGVVEKREQGVAEATQIAQYALQGQRQTLQYGEDTTNLQARQAILGIEQEQDFARRSRFMDLLELNNDQLMLLEEISGGTLPSQITTPTAIPSAPTRSTVTGTTTTTQPSQDLNTMQGRAAARGAARAPTQAPTTRTTKITSSDLNARGQALAQQTTFDLSTIQGRAESRGAARARSALGY